MKTIIKKINNNSKNTQYRIGIINLSDSILLIVRSPNLILINNIEPPIKLIPLLESTSTDNEYTFYYTPVDTMIQEFYRKSAEILLPHQSLEFSFELERPVKTNSLMLEYFFTPDLCYKEFVKEMVGNWRKKYKTLNKKIKLPDN